MNVKEFLETIQALGTETRAADYVATARQLWLIGRYWQKLDHSNSADCRVLHATKLHAKITERLSTSTTNTLADSLVLRLGRLEVRDAVKYLEARSQVEVEKESGK